MPGRILLAIMLSLVLWAGCREQEVEPPHNRNLGTAEAPLLPPQATLVDTDILTGPRVQPTGLPEFDRDLPTLAEIESRKANAAEESARDQGAPDDQPPDEDDDDEDEEDQEADR